MNDHEPPADDVMMRYANGTLPASERAAVDDWLREHPEWEPRLALHRSLGDAFRASSASMSPDTSFSALWPVPDARGSADVVPLGPTSPPRRRAPWLVAAAGAVAAAVVAVLVIIGPGRGPDRPAGSGPASVATAPSTTVATTAATTTTTSSSPNDTQTLRDAVAASRARGTARGRLVADVSLTDAADIAEAEAQGRGPAGQVTGTAFIEFPGRWSLETVNAVEPIDAYSDAQVTQGLVGSGSSLQVHCGTGLEPLVDLAAAGCPVVPLGTTFLSPTGVFDVIGAATDVTFAYDVEVNGAGRRYSFSAVLAIGDAEPVEVDFDVDVLDDGNVIDTVTARTQYRASGESALLDLWLTWTFDQYGVGVTIPGG